jgi:hypothetical protein
MDMPRAVVINDLRMPRQQLALYKSIFISLFAPIKEHVKRTNSLQREARVCEQIIEYSNLLRRIWSSIPSVNTFINAIIQK